MSRSVYNAKPGSKCMFGLHSVDGDRFASRCSKPALIGYVMHDRRMELCRDHMDTATSAMTSIEEVVRAAELGKDLSRD